MLKKTKGPRAAGRAATLVESVRPIVARAMQDPELHEAIRQAFVTGREVGDEISGKPPRKAAKRLANDRKLQRKVESSAIHLRKAVGGLVEKPRRRRGRKLLRGLAILGAVGGAVVLVKRRLHGGGGGENDAGQ